MSLHAGAIVFVCAFGGALIGVYLGRLLPQRHLTPETKDVVRLGMGMVATVAALVLGLLIESAKTSYDTQNEELAQVSANVVLLDRLLRHYGPEADAGRMQLRAGVERALETIWTSGKKHANLSPDSIHSEALYDTIQELTPKDDRQRAIQSQASSLAVTLGQARWLMFEQTSATLATPLVVVMSLWLTSVFVSWGMYSPFNTTTVVVFFVAALSVSASVVLIQELYSPYTGLLRVPSTPLRRAYVELRQGTAGP